MSNLPRDFFVCKACGGRGTLFPKQSDPLGNHDGQVQAVRC